MKRETKIIHGGRGSDVNRGCVNVPIYPTSTIVFNSMEELKNADHAYGRTGNVTSIELQKMIAELEGGYNSVVTSSGIAAITLVLTAFLQKGDHILVTDSIYSPTRYFCDSVLKKFGIEATYYQPYADGGIEPLIQDNTKLIFVESPGSMTFDIQDVPAIAEIAHKKGILVIGDNSWATPLYFDAFAKGIDISIHAATKYMGGHSDLLLGSVTTKDKDLYDHLLATFKNLGCRASPYESYLVARGLKTMSTRVKQHGKSALDVAKWLESREEVSQVFYPALESHPQHDLWKRDFTGATGLLSFTVKEKYSIENVDRMVDNMDIFDIGFSWGAYESLIMPFYDHFIRSIEHGITGTLIRLHVGLEDVDDLKADLEKGFSYLRK